MLLPAAFLAIALQKLVLVLLVPDEWASLPVATARACAPYWLEAAGWLVELLSDATAAAMGRLPATKRSTAVYRSTLDVVVSVVAYWGRCMQPGLHPWSRVAAWSCCE